MRHYCVGVLLLVVLVILSCQTQPEQEVITPSFNAERAFSYLEAQVKFGPRVPGSPEHGLCRDYITRHISKGAKVLQTQEFPIDCFDEPARGTNIVAGFGKEIAPAIVLACHWDTRPIANLDPDLENRDKPIPGANDGASGVAVLLELANQFAEKPPPRRVYLVFFDAEDAGDYRDCDWCLGSQYFAMNVNTVFSSLPAFGVVIDMIGDKDLSLPKEVNSQAAAPDVLRHVWGVAERLGYKQFESKMGPSIFDDHIWLNRAGIPTIDIIDFDYLPWHTMGDDVDKCSKESLKAVGDVLYALVYEKHNL